MLGSIPNVSSEDKKSMIVGERLRELREEKKLSQGEIEERTGIPERQRVPRAARATRAYRVP